MGRELSIFRKGNEIYFYDEGVRRGGGDVKNLQSLYSCLK